MTILAKRRQEINSINIAVQIAVTFAFILFLMMNITNWDTSFIRNLVSLFLYVFVPMNIY